MFSLIRPSSLTGLALSFVLSWGAHAYAEEASAAAKPHIEDDKVIFNVVFENDVFAGTDQGYTNGIRFAWLSSEERVPDWARYAGNAILPFGKDGNKRVSIALGQSMYAPTDLSSAVIAQDDRPYAGWLYGSVGIVSDSDDALDNAVLTVGVIGPSSLAEQTQKAVHRVTDSPDPHGWGNQLKTEPTIGLSYERKWRALIEAEPFGLASDVIPHMGATIGNVNTSANIGGTLRVGFDLPADYGPPRIRPSLPGSDFFVPTKALGGYLFGTVEGRAVARDIFLDGNTFKDSHSVDKENFVGSLQFGAAMTLGEARLSYTHVMMTREFETQTETPQFGALTLSYRF
jgi:lipid A 3-O-deacylase